MNKIVFSLLIIIFGGLHLKAENITVRAVNEPMEKVFEKIMKQSGMNFVYPSSLFDKTKVSVDIIDLPIDKALDRLFKDIKVNYKIKGNNVILTPAKKNKKQEIKTVSLTGFVRETGSGEPLAGALIKGNSGVAAVTNVMGFYSLSIPEGTYTVNVTYPGYFPSTLSQVDLSSNLNKDFYLTPDSQILEDLVVYGSKNKDIAMETTGIGEVNLNKGVIMSTPVIFGESDVIKTLQHEPGVSAGVEGMAGLYVHGGNSDENLYMLDNIPLYQVNHVGGLFSAFNSEVIRNVNFHKSSFPGKYDGRLSSYMDVHTKDGSLEAHHGSARLGLTSGSFSIEGPIWKGHTSYLFSMRRSWFDLLTLPICAIYNATSKDEKYTIGLAFTDINAKITHRFNEKSSIWLSGYFGEDYLKVKQSFEEGREIISHEHIQNKLNWGNLVVSAGWNYVFAPRLFGQFTGAFTRYKSKLSHEEEEGLKEDKIYDITYLSRITSDNNIQDWIFRGDFDWLPTENHTVGFGAYYINHSFLPFRNKRVLYSEEFKETLTDNIKTYHANEVNIYGQGDWTANDRLRFNYGFHYSLFNIDGKTHHGLSPRFTFRYVPADSWAVKAGYSRTVQYVHQLIQSSISLPTDQWVPIMGGQKPQTADKIFAGVYWSPIQTLTLSVEGYWKWMNNLLDYADEYYLLAQDYAWNEKMVSGKGASRGFDFRVAKEFGNITGHLSYSLLWADRCFPDKNKGKKFPARFDNRHKINILVNWKLNKKWEINASWTGMSGNRITLPTQCWTDPGLAPWHYNMTLATDINNFRLPFYHRLDLSFTRHNKNGFWNFSLYNAYCNINTIGVIRDYKDNYSNTGQIEPSFRKIKLLPIIPSISYTWIF